MSSPRAYIVMAASLAILFSAAPTVEGAADLDYPIKAVDTSVLQLKIGESFLAVRARIIRYGWKPVRMHSNDAYEYDGAEKRLAERGFLEVDSCSIDAAANCTLYYRNATKCLRVDTVGEQVDDMKVTRWMKECPSE